MNTARKLSAVAVLALLTGCATSGMARNEDPGYSKVDGAYVAAVEEAARTAPVRVRVIWVRAPDQHVEE